MESLGVSVFIVSYVLNNSGHSLSGGIKLESEVLFWKVLLSNSLIINLASFNELKHSEFSGTGIINSSLTIARDSF